MSRRRLLVWGLVLLLACVAGSLLLRKPSPAGPSVLSRGSAGWLAARAYLERTQRRTTLQDRPFDATGEQGTWIVAFPWQRFQLPNELDELNRHLTRGGTIVYAYSGEQAVFEEFVADQLRLSPRQVRGRPPLDPRRWYAFASEEWRLTPAEELGTIAQEVVIRAPRVVPASPEGAQVLYRGPDGVAAAFTYTSGHGRVVVIPADALSNARLGNPGNAELLESLASSLAPPLVFDEYHHGLSAPGLSAGSANARSLDLLILQLVLLYLLYLWAVSRRFGPSWREPATIASSTTSFLLGLGALHRRLGHSAGAAERLIRNAEALDPRLSVPQSIRTQAAADENALLDVARSVARRQRHRRTDSHVSDTG